MNAEVLDQGSLIKSVSIEGLLAKREATLAKIREALDALDAACTLAGSAGFTREHYGFDWMLQGKDHYRRTDLLEGGAFERIRARLDAGAWDHLMRESGLLTFMDSKARDDWRGKIDNCQTPALTRDNIAATFGALYQARGDMFERGVIGCFHSLSYCYKTNSPVKFGKRIVKYLGQHNFAPERMQALADLQRVFCVLDGKPEEDHRNGFVQRLYSAKSAAGPFIYASRGEHDDVYMHVRWFKNGNGHITFKRADLVARLNGILAKHFPNALPPAED